MHWEQLNPNTKDVQRDGATRDGAGRQAIRPIMPTPERLNRVSTTRLERLHAEPPSHIALETNVLLWYVPLCLLRQNRCFATHESLCRGASYTNT